MYWNVCKQSNFSNLSLQQSVEIHKRPSPAWRLHRGQGQWALAGAGLDQLSGCEPDIA